MPEVRALPSTGITRFQRYYSPLRFPPRPVLFSTVTGRDPAPGTGLPRCPRYLPDVPSSLPRWTRQVLLTVSSLPASAFPVYRTGLRPQLYFRGLLKVHSRYGPPVRCLPRADICPQSFSKKVSLSYCPGSYRDEPTISRAELSSAGTLHLRGAPICSGYLNDGQIFNYAMKLLY